jgi:outer membrane protein assembly factor BamE (lipoprotein component of BamABCDE complex)
MSLLKHVDRIALVSMLIVSLAVPATAVACSADGAQSIHVTARALSDDSFRNINVGMSAAEVLARLGPPDTKMRFERSKTTSWDYHFFDTWNYDSDFSVTFDDRDIVVSRFTERLGQ